MKLKRLLLVAAALLFLTSSALGQGNLGTCTVTHYQLNEPITTVTENQDVKLICPGLSRWVTQANHQMKLTLQAQPSGRQSKPFSGNALISRDEALFQTPFGTTGSTALILYVNGAGSYLINFTPPVVEAAPILYPQFTLSVISRDGQIPIIRMSTPDGVVTFPRLDVFFTFQTENVGNGGTVLWTFTNLDTGEVIETGDGQGRVVPRSSGRPAPEAYAFIPIQQFKPGRYRVKYRFSFAQHIMSTEVVIVIGAAGE